MPRRREVPKREILPDPKYGNVELSKFMNVIMEGGKKAVAERIIYGHLGGAGKVFISNTHFDTTRANIEFSGATAIDIPIPEGLNPEAEHPFKGNMDVAALDRLLTTHAGHVGAVILTVTNNTGGGQPVSLANTADVSATCRRHGVIFLLDCCRIAENSWFVRHRESGMESVTYREIAQRMFSLADGAVMSAKKDGLANMGGFLALRDDAIADACSNLLIISEGFTTYGGLSGRDMEAIAIGLEEVFDAHYLDYRIRSTTFLGEHLHALGVPLMRPIGGHAVYVRHELDPVWNVDAFHGNFSPSPCNQYRNHGASIRSRNSSAVSWPPKVTSPIESAVTLCHWPWNHGPATM